MIFDKRSARKPKVFNKRSSYRLCPNNIQNDDKLRTGCGSRRSAANLRAYTRYTERYKIKSNRGLQ